MRASDVHESRVAQSTRAGASKEDSYRIEQPRYLLYDTNNICYQLSRIKSVVENEKMELLKLLYSNKDSIGHLCLCRSNKKNRALYADVLYSLQPKNIFTILKLTNSKNDSIFTLYHTAGLDLCGLIARCKEDPKVFCEILEYFEINNTVMQSLVNVVKLKGTIRTYLVNLPDNTENWNLLDRCLDVSTTIGKFCAKKAMRISEFFKKDETSVTVSEIRKKVDRRPLVIAVCSIPPYVAMTPTAPEAPPGMFSEPDTFLIKTTNLANDLQEESDIRPQVVLSPNVKDNSAFWFYIACATVIMTTFIALIYQKMNQYQEDIPLEFSYF